MDRRPSSGGLGPESSNVNTNLRRQYSTIRVTSPGPAPERGKQPTYQDPQAVSSPTQDDFTNNHYPAPFLSAATFKPPVGHSQTRRNRHKTQLARRAYLRHSFNRIDFIAVVSYWIAFALQISGVMSARHIYIFQMLSCLRIFRLLGITEGTTVSASPFEADERQFFAH
jgi:Ion transport protein